MWTAKRQRTGNQPVWRRRTRAGHVRLACPAAILSGRVSTRFTRPPRRNRVSRAGSSHEVSPASIAGLLLLATSSPAQTTFAAITGVITDASGAATSGAAVTAFVAQNIVHVARDYRRLDARLEAGAVAAAVEVSVRSDVDRDRIRSHFRHQERGAKQTSLVLASRTQTVNPSNFACSTILPLEP